MIIRKLIICDYKNKQANSFTFNEGANIIASHKNTSGKSCILKSLLYVLGFETERFASNWHASEMLFKVYFTHNSKDGYIIRAKNKFWVSDTQEVLSLKEYSEWFYNLLDINIKLPLKDKKEMQLGYAGIPLLLHYIDQDTSWGGSLYKDTCNFSWYSSDSIPKAIFENVLGFNDDNYIKLSERKIELEKKRNQISTQQEVLDSLKDKFLSPNSLSTNFDEAGVKKQIENYLKYATILSEKINDYKRQIYTKKIALDALLLDQQELQDILTFLNTSYKEIKCRCTHCNSLLTPEQSLKRMKLDDNRISVELYYQDLSNKIEQLKKELEDLYSQKIGIEDEYSKFLEISNTKNDELTLVAYINNKANELSNDKYTSLKNELNTAYIDTKNKIKDMTHKLTTMKKSLAKIKENITKTFDSTLLELNKIFPKISLEGYEFLNFRKVKESGSADNQLIFALYMAYMDILVKYSKLDLPFVIDSIIKSDLDGDVLKTAYKTIDKIILSSNKHQSFLAGLTDNLNFLMNKYNHIIIDSNQRILNKEGYLKYENEFNIIFKKNLSEL